MKICEHCAELISYSYVEDNSFYHEVGYYYSRNDVYVCRDGCDSYRYVKAESEFSRRYYRRYKQVNDDAGLWIAE